MLSLVVVVVCVWMDVPLCLLFMRSIAIPQIIILPIPVQAALWLSSDGLSLSLSLSVSLVNTDFMRQRRRKRRRKAPIIIYRVPKRLRAFCFSKRQARGEIVSILLYGPPFGVYCVAPVLLKFNSPRTCWLCPHRNVFHVTKRGWASVMNSSRPDGPMET